ncbi:MAG TPA: hypothetical protein VM076_23930 [Gemmatimonadaceae bacterium]|nr:hypothetical protein [Gemmatimonadaceae bacterium]
MHAIRLPRSSAQTLDLVGRVICHELRSDDGRVAIAKGRVLDADDAARALELSWSELHLLALDDGDVHEEAAGSRIAQLVAGDGVETRAPSGGHWPLAATTRGLLSIANDALEAVNDLDGPCVYSLLDGQVVEAGDVVARAKIIPFTVTTATLDGVAALAGETGVVSVRPFLPHRVAGVVHASLGDRALARFRKAVDEKLDWFGSTLCALETTASEVSAVAGALRRARDSGAQIVLVAGTKAMDVLDPTFEAVQAVGGTMVRQGVPAHPGSLLWLADWGGVPVVGMPTCGLFAQATVFDVVVARLLTGERVDRRALSRLAQGGLLTKDMAFRLPAYRAAAERGAVE